MPDYQPMPDQYGLNLQAVFDIPALPEDVYAILQDAVPELANYRQLHLFGHGGRQMWEALKISAFADHAEPVDDFSAYHVQRYFEEMPGDVSYRLLFPGGEGMVPLRRMGELAGWHHASPLRIGVNDIWGSWFAYRAVVLADTGFPAHVERGWTSPCVQCTDRPCITACPARAMDRGQLELNACIDERLQDASACQQQCLARLACPVAGAHRYDDDQIHYSYGRSLLTLKAWRTSIKTGA